MKINYNMTAVIANASLNINENNFYTSAEKMSSGYKLNHAKQNPAGIAIAKRTNAQIGAIAKAKQNTSDAISVVRTAEGAISEIQSMVHRMSELAIESANGTKTAEDREVIQKEIDELKVEIDRMMKETDFNGKKLLNGDCDLKGYASDLGVKVQYYSDEVKVGDYTFRVNPPDLNPVQDAAGNTLYIGADGRDVTEQVTPGEGFQQGATIVPNAAGDGVTVTETDADGNPVTWTLPIDPPIDADTTGTIDLSYSFSIDEDQNITLGEGFPAGAVAAMNVAGDEVTITDNAGNVLATFSVEPGTTGEVKHDYSFRINPQVQGYVDAENNQTRDRVTLGAGFPENAMVSYDGNEVTVTADNSFEMKFTVADDDFDPVNPRPIGDVNGNVTLDITGIGAMRVQIGANEGQVIAIRIPIVSLEAMGLADADLSTEEGANKLIDATTQANAYISAIRARIGAYENRLEHTEDSLDTLNENLTGAYSRMMDTDVAEEMTNYTNLQVLNQAGISMLTQANQRPAEVLQLLQ